MIDVYAWVERRALCIGKANKLPMVTVTCVPETEHTEILTLNLRIYLYVCMRCTIIVNNLNAYINKYSMQVRVLHVATIMRNAAN